jgi:hypothetical protein
MHRIRTALVVAAVATVTLAGCVLTPPAAPPIDPGTTASGTPAPQPTSPSQPPSAQPSQPAPGGGESATVDGSTATLSADGVTWRLELLEMGPAPLDELTEYNAEEGAPAPAPPSGYEVGWACFRMTLVEAADQYATLVDVVRDVRVPGGEDAWDYEVIENEHDMYGASGEAGDVLDRVCPVLLVPEGFAYDAVTIELATESGDEVTVEVPAP